MFLLFEPLGLYGIWVKIRNYWKGWPFTLLSGSSLRTRASNRRNHTHKGET